MPAPHQLKAALKSSRVQLLCEGLPKLEIILPPHEFTIFPKFPPELRLRVWRFAAMAPRNIQLRLRNYVPMIDDQPETPAILRTSLESRKEGKRYYTFCRELNSAPGQPDGGFRNMVWINMKVDNFVLDEEILLGRRGAAVDLATYFNLEGSVINNIRYLEMEGTRMVSPMVIRRALKVFERLLLGTSLHIFKFQFWSWRRSTYHGFAEYEQVANEMKDYLRKLLAKEDKRWTVEFQIEM